MPLRLICGPWWTAYGSHDRRVTTQTLPTTRNPLNAFAKLEDSPLHEPVGVGFGSRE